MSENDPHAEVDSYVGPYDTGNVDVDQSLAVVDFGVGYRLGKWAFPGSARAIQLDALAGGRYVHYATDVRYNIGGLSYREDLIGNLWSPFLGARWQLDVLDNLAIAFRGDIGGLTLGHQLNCTCSPRPPGDRRFESAVSRTCRLTMPLARRRGLAAA